MIYQFQMESDGTSHFPYVSKGGEDIYGFSANLKLPPSGRKASSVIHPDDALRVAKTIVESAQQLTLWRQEYRVCLPERGERWVSGVARPQPLESGAVLWHGYIQDITEQKHQAMELEEAQRMLQHLLHAMPVALCGCPSSVSVLCASLPRRKTCQRGESGFMLHRSSPSRSRLS